MSKATSVAVFTAANIATWIGKDEHDPARQAFLKLMNGGSLNQGVTEDHRLLSALHAANPPIGTILHSMGLK